MSSLICLLIQIFISYLIMTKSKHKKKVFPPLQLTPWMIFYLLFTCGISLKYLGELYSTIPISVPFIFKSYLGDELSFISVVRNFRRENLFFFKEPLLYDSYYRGYPSPLLYIASLMAFGASYSDASIIVCFLNTIATACVIAKTAKKYTVWFIIPCMFFLFSGPSATRLLFNAKNRNDIRNDLVHQIDNNHQTISYPTFFCLLSFLKSTSYTIPLAQYAYSSLNTNNIFSFFLLLLLPNSSCIVGVFVIFIIRSKSNFLFFKKLFTASFSHSKHEHYYINIKTILLFLLLLIFKFLPFNFSFYPLFREESMRGTLFAAFKIWFDVFSIAFLSLFFIGETEQKLRAKIFSRISGVCVLIFLRESNDRLMNFTAIVSIFSMSLYILFSMIIKIMACLPKSNVIKGCLLYIHWVIFFTFIFGGFICGYRILKSKEMNFNNQNYIDIIDYINKNIPVESILFIRPHLYHPAILTGRKIFLGNRRSLFLHGYKITQRNKEYGEIIKSNFSKSLLEKHNIYYVIDTISETFFLNDTLSDLNIIKENSQYRIVKF